ncbi:prepilin-type N-terminal cleavage/methylation domain-containing protein [Bordetella trematum]|uniref:prepilin-type N-terminal cleavage/methylation domain-containing protein n=1 Tax=Bordetella trematum TaxID=123899 RepID=UPI000C75A3BD|nr:prepilin-type N-terminal cleavage/methylation domain-containing protein [Bordetella trematum]AUL47809.1 prepilin-type N-terminal cleavage/methylation domain-containing protein [Bordetella trematum]
MDYVARAAAIERRQQGFSLIEVSVVAAILLMAAVIGVPAIHGYVIESRVPKLAEELQRFVVRMRIQAVSAGAAPYAGMDNAILAQALQDSSVVSISGEGASREVRHGLGDGRVTLASATRPGQPVGSAFTLTLDNVHPAACPSLASALQRLAFRVSVQGRAAAVQVKDDLATPARPYQPLLAAAQCGSSNRFAFTFP